MAIRLRTIIKHPARVEGDTGVSVEKQNGIVTVALDLAAFSEVASIADESHATVLLVTPGATEGVPAVVERISVDNLVAESDAVLEARQIISGAGLTGGGDLAADRTLAVGAGDGLAVNADEVALDTAHARNVDHSTVSVIAGAGLTGGGTIASDRTLTVGAGTGIAVSADDVALDTAHARNVDHSSVSVLAGAGLTGGGPIDADRTLTVGAGAGIMVNADDVALDPASTRNTDHAAVTLAAGAGLIGGGDISASRSFAVGAGTGIAVNADDVALAPIADDMIMANVSGGPAAPGASTLSEILDAIVSNARGTLLARGESGWAALPLGTNGHFLGSDGTDVAYAAIPGGGDLLSTNNLSDVANADTARDNLNAELKFASGTLMLFQQTAAPTGYTKQTTHNDKALRVVSGTASSGGTSAFSTVFGKTATDGTTLTNSHLPTSIGGATTATEYSFTSGESAVGTNPLVASGATGYPNSGGGNAHTHPMDIRVQYVDIIIASKD